ncbi:MAG: hypothetical protein JNN07_09015 [Verrucomicrobiales bacterium]|nr:hypothetical protein [Verrucomicrobiales bacterium]
MKARDPQPQRAGRALSTQSRLGELLHYGAIGILLSFILFASWMMPQLARSVDRGLPKEAAAELLVALRAIVYGVLPVVCVVLGMTAKLLRRTHRRLREIEAAEGDRAARSAGTECAIGGP